MFFHTFNILAKDMEFAIVDKNATKIIFKKNYQMPRTKKLSMIPQAVRWCTFFDAVA